MNDEYLSSDIEERHALILGSTSKTLQNMQAKVPEELHRSFPTGKPDDRIPPFRNDNCPARRYLYFKYARHIYVKSVKQGVPLGHRGEAGNQPCGKGMGGYARCRPDGTDYDGSGQRKVRARLIRDTPNSEESGRVSVSKNLRRSEYLFLRKSFINVTLCIKKTS